MVLLPPRLMINPLTAALVGGILFSPLVIAEDTASDGNWQAGLGIGFATTQKPYKDIDRDNTPVPLLYFENDFLRFFGTGAQIKLPSLQLSENQRLNFSLTGRYDGSGYEASDAAILRDMSERKGGFWAGVAAEWQTPLVNLRADWSHDLSGHSKGQQVKLSVDKAWHLSEGFTLTPRIATIWHDSKFNDYYYGVRPEEAAADRAPYQGESAFSTEIGLQAAYKFNPHHAVMLDIQTTQLPSTVKDSPLVDSSSENRIFLGYIYHF